MGYVGMAAVLAMPWVLGSWGAGNAWAQVVPRVEQAQRDQDRVRILQAELASEQGRADTASKRHAERLAAHDTLGADEAEQARQRALQNLTALRRELESARSAPSRPVSVTARRPPPDPVSPWWDVYARAPRPADRPAPPRSSVPSPE
jgi:hypothetical protein